MCKCPNTLWGLCLLCFPTKIFVAVLTFILICFPAVTVMNQTNRPWLLRGPRTLMKSLQTFRLTLQPSCLSVLFSGWKNWERPRNMRAPHRVPSQCNICSQTLLSVFTRDDFQKKQNVLHGKRDGRTLPAGRTASATALCFSRYGELK